VFILLDFSVRFQTTFQDIASRGMYGLLVLNGFVFQYLVLIMVIVSGLIFNVIQKFQLNSRGFSNKYNNYNV
jgi:hypothetical protein